MIKAIIQLRPVDSSVSILTEEMVLLSELRFIENSRNNANLPQVLNKFATLYFEKYKLNSEVVWLKKSEEYSIRAYNEYVTNSREGGKLYDDICENLASTFYELSNELYYNQGILPACSVSIVEKLGEKYLEELKEEESKSNDKKNSLRLDFCLYAFTLVYDNYLKKFGPNNPATMRAALSLGEICYEKKDKRAIEYFKIVFAASVALYGRSHQDTKLCAKKVRQAEKQFFEEK